MLFSILMFSVALVAATQDNEDQAEMPPMRKAICDSGDQEMFKEMDDCFQREHEAVVAATADCARRAVPSSEGGAIPFMNAACEDLSIFRTFDACFNEYKANSTFESVMVITDEVNECYQGVIDKYNLDSSKNILKDSE